MSNDAVSDACRRLIEGGKLSDVSYDRHHNFCPM